LLWSAATAAVLLSQTYSSAQTEPDDRPFTLDGPWARSKPHPWHPRVPHAGWRDDGAGGPGAARAAGGVDFEVVPVALGLAVAVVAAAAVFAGPIALAIPVGLACVIFLVREPLAPLVLYVYIGLSKEEAVVQAIPVDATVALGALLALVCFARLVSHQARPIRAARCSASRSRSRRPRPCV
jgi:hypothetical protein